MDIFSVAATGTGYTGEPTDVMTAAAQLLFSGCYNRKSFRFRHGLSDLEGFSRSGLEELARLTPLDPAQVYWSNGAVEADDRWETNPPRLSLVDTVDGIEANNSFVMFRHIELDPVLGRRIRELLAEVVRLSGERMRSDVIVGRASILLASPHRITPYHIDADCNHLLQLSGNKMLSVFDQDDRSLLCDEELERYFAGDFNGAVFKDHRQDEGVAYAIGPGDGVHIPSTAPHWARNGDTVSIALSLNFDIRSCERKSGIYRFNRQLRRLGLHPSAPGRSGWRDRLKLASMTGAETLKRLTRRGERVREWPGWSVE